MTTNQKGSVFYTPPEIENTSNFCLESDIYSLGMILYEMLANFRTKSERMKTFRKFKENFLLNEKIFSNKYSKNLLYKMLDPCPLKRIKA